MRITALLLVTLGLAACNTQGPATDTMAPANDMNGAMEDTMLEDSAMENAEGMGADMSGI